LAKKKAEITIRSSAAEYLTYVASVGDQQDSIEMRYEDENIWLTQKMIATLYDVGLPTINEHIKKIYADSELEEAATIRNFRTIQTGKIAYIPKFNKYSFSPWFSSSIFGAILYSLLILHIIYGSISQSSANNSINILLNLNGKINSKINANIPKTIFDAIFL